jgi:hypothetical protein
MSTVSLHRGDVLVLAREGRPDLRRRVLYICPASARVVLFDVDDRNSLPEWTSLGGIVDELRVARLRVSDADPCPPDRRGDTYVSDRRKKDRDRWWAVIQPEVHFADGELDPAIFDAEELRERVRRMCAVADTTPNVIRKWLRRWWRHGQEVNALLSGFDRSGGRGKAKRVVSGRKRGRPKVYVVPEDPGLNVTEWERSRLVKGGLRFHQRRGMSLEQAWQATKEAFFRRLGAEGVEVRDGVPVPILLPARQIPSFAQFRYWYGKERDRRAEYQARHGERATVLHRDPKGGTFQNNVPGPGHTYIIDATVGDIYLLSTLEPGRVIGRPVIYFVIDAFSLAIVGLHVGLEGPNWTGAKAAMENAFADKSKFLREHGIDPEVHLWPCSGICLKITADRGELLGKPSDHAVRAFELTITNCPAYRPDLKALVEGQFKIANDRVIHWQPGAVYKARDRGDPDYRFDATYTLRAFTKLMIIHALEHNNAVGLRN